MGRGDPSGLSKTLVGAAVGSHQNRLTPSAAAPAAGSGKVMSSALHTELHVAAPSSQKPFGLLLNAHCEGRYYLQLLHCSIALAMYLVIGER